MRSWEKDSPHHAADEEEDEKKEKKVPFLRCMPNRDGLSAVHSPGSQGHGTFCVAESEAHNGTFHACKGTYTSPHHIAFDKAADGEGRTRSEHLGPALRSLLTALV